MSSQLVSPVLGVCTCSTVITSCLPRHGGVRVLERHVLVGVRAGCGSRRCGCAGACSARRECACGDRGGGGCAARCGVPEVLAEDMLWQRSGVARSGSAWGARRRCGCAGG
eukprot:6465557-Amphidinium_carterae.1